MTVTQSIDRTAAAGRSVSGGRSVDESSASLAAGSTAAPGSTAARSEGVITFTRPLLGWPDSRRYALAPLGEGYGPFCSLVSLDEDGLRFVVVAPATLFTDYRFEVPDDDVAALDLRPDAKVSVFVLVRTRGVPSPVVNLLAPIVVNPHSGAAAQVVLAESGYGLMVPVDAGTARP